VSWLIGHSIGMPYFTDLLQMQKGYPGGDVVAPVAQRLHYHGPG
jgi:hypothetical protein